jgi:hypothetical protein
VPAQRKSVAAPRPKRRATKTKVKPVAPARRAKGAKPKPKTKLVAPIKRAVKAERSVPTKAVPKRTTRRVVPTKSVSKAKTKPVVLTKPVSRRKAKPVAPTKPVPKPKKKLVAPAKPKVKPVSIAPTEGAKTKAFVAAAKSPASQAKTSAVKPTLVAGPGLRCLANHRLRRGATGRLYCAFCDR